MSRAQLDSADVTAPRITRALRDGRLDRVAHGVYDLLPVPFAERVRDPDLRRDDIYDHRRRRPVWLGMLAHGPDAVAVGQSALVLHDVEGLPVQPLVEVTRLDRRGRMAHDGIVLRRYEAARWYQTVHDRLVVPVDLALAQAVPSLDRRHAVAVMDSVLHRQLLTDLGLAGAHDLARGRRSVERTHDWWDVADGRAESPAETFARLSCIDEGVPPDVLQQVFLPRQGRRVRVDMAWWLGRGRWLINEVDGREAHSSPEPLFHDRARQNLLTASGHTVLRHSGADAWAGRPGREIAAQLAKEGWAPGRAVPRGPFPLS